MVMKLTEADHEKVSKAIAAAEATTDGEIVAVGPRLSPAGTIRSAGTERPERSSLRSREATRLRRSLCFPSRARDRTTGLDVPQNR